MSIKILNKTPWHKYFNQMETQKQNSDAERHFYTRQKIVDALLCLLSLVLAYFIRFETILPKAEDGLELLFIALSPALVIITLYFFHKHQLYNPMRFSSKLQELSKLFKANAFSFCTFVLVIYFLSPQRVSRIALANYFIISTILFLIFRVLLRNYLRKLRSQGKYLKNYLLVGNGEQLLSFIETIRRFKDSGVNIVGWIDDEGLAANTDIKTLEESVEDARINYQIHTIVVAHKNDQSEKIEKLLKSGHQHLTNLQLLPDLSYSLIGHQISDFAGVPIMSLNQPGMSSFDLFLKRLMDFSLSLLALIFLSPILLVLAILVKLTSKGPIFYGQERVGLDGQAFVMWKFRSMRTDAEKDQGAQWAVKNDSRRTPIGTLLRSTSLDELPQFYNVLIGDMSLVGPRPERPIFVDQFKTEIEAYMLRHKVKAGITGWAQVNGWRGDTSLEKRIECDIYYIKNWSIIFDFKILFMTFWSGFINKNAY